MRHRWRLRETGWVEFGYLLCYFKMVAPRALVFRPLVKGNGDSGNEIVNYMITMLLLVSRVNTHNHLLYCVRFCAGSTPNIAKTLTTKSFAWFCAGSVPKIAKTLTTKSFARFHNHFSLRYAAQHSYVPLLSLRRDSPSKIVPDFLCATL